MNPRQRRAILLLALAAAGLLGVFALVASYVSNVETKVGPTVDVLELTHAVKANEAISDDMVVDKPIPQRWAPAAALRDRSQLVGYVAASDLAKNSILQEGMIASPPQLGPDQREEAILVDASTGVAGQIDPGALVDVIADYPAGDTPNGKKDPNRSVVVVSGARVLNVGQPRLKGANGVQDAQQDPSQVVPVTFALTKQQELRVSYAQSFATDVRLALLRPGESLNRTLPETIYEGADPTTGLNGGQ